VEHSEPSRRPYRLFTVALLCALVLLWISGTIGRVLTRWIVPPLLPLELSNVVVLDRLTIGPPPACPPLGALIIISPERTASILHQALPATRWLPPGLAHDGVILHGFVKSRALNLPLEEDIPLIIAIDDDVGYRPHLTGRAPAALINTFLKEGLGDKLSSRDDYFLGEYRIIYKPTFETLHIYSVEDYMPEPVRRRSFAFEATGDMRIKIDDKRFRITTDGRVRRLNGTIESRVLYDHEGYGFWYDVDVRDLRININDLQEWLDHSASEKLEIALEKAMDRRRNKTKLMKRRVPHWVPVDMAVDFRLTSD